MTIDCASLAIGFCCGGGIVFVALVGLVLWRLRDYRPMGY